MEVPPVPSRCNRNPHEEVKNSQSGFICSLCYIPIKHNRALCKDCKVYFDAVVHNHNILFPTNTCSIPCPIRPCSNPGCDNIIKDNMIHCDRCYTTPSTTCCNSEACRFKQWYDYIRHRPIDAQ